MKTEHEVFGYDDLRLETLRRRPLRQAEPDTSPYAGEALGEEQEESRRYETCAGCGEEWNVSRMAREGWYICPRCAYRYGRR